MHSLLSNSIHLLLLTTSLLFFQFPSNSNAQQILTSCPASYSNYTNGTQFQVNLNSLFTSLYTNGPPTGYNITTSGEDPDRVYGLVQCRDDISEEDCRNCVNATSVEIVRLCPNKKVAAIRFENCLLRYSDRSFFYQSETAMRVWVRSLQNVSNPDLFNEKLGGLMDNLTSTAASSPFKFATGNTSIGPFEKIYGLVQCTRDLSKEDCNTCLRITINDIPPCCEGMTSGHVLVVSCFLKFATNPFFTSSRFLPPSPSPRPVEAPPPQDTSTTSTGSGQKSQNSSPNLAVIVVPTIIGVLLLLTVCVCLLRRKTKTEIRDVVHVDGDGDGDEIGSTESLQFGLGTIRIATRDFSDTNKLGEGGFGAVYKGELSNGQEIAVKRLSRNSGQGSLEFKNEVMLLYKLQHRNLVRLLGFCLEGEEKILIYEYVPNTSLDKYLFDPTKRAYLNWETRYKIIGGIARGLLYLHEDSRLRIIHRDLKASNILLDGDMNPKVADFGLAKLFEVDQTQGNTSRIAGTLGYMAPEYVFHGLFSVKSDVFSFGVLLLEIISGRKINSFNDQSGPSQDLISYAWKHWREGTVLELMDPTLADNFSTSEVMRSIHIGLLCAQENIEDRPTMSSVVLMLNSYSVTLASPSPPAFFSESRTGPSVLNREWKSDQSTGNSVPDSTTESTIVSPR